jgi:hypothetical protein
MTLWGALVGFSGTSKTPGLNVAIRALEAYESGLDEQRAYFRRRYETRKVHAEATRKKWKDDCEKAAKSNKDKPEMPEVAEVPERFIVPCLYKTDATIEKMALQLQARPSGMLLILDELSHLLQNMSRHSQGGQDDGFWLQAHDGKPFRQGRVGRADINIPHLLIGLIGGLQPDKLAESFRGAADGMYARFLFTWPDRPPYRPLIDNAFNEPAIARVIERLAKLAGDDPENFKPKIVPLSKLAREAFEDLRKEVHAEVDSFYGREQDWWSKIPGLVLRLAGTLSYVNWAMRDEREPKEIRVEYVEAAIDLVQDYYWPHARACLRQIGLTERDVNARRALVWMRNNKREVVAVQDIRRHALAESLDATQTKELLGRLEKAGWLRKSAKRSGDRGGKPVVRWTVNSMLFATKR